MMQRPWDRAQPDEWLPRNLRLCWGSESGSGTSSSGSEGGGFDGGAFTGGGDWGSSGSFDASSFNAGGDLAAGMAFDAGFMGHSGGGDWSSFGPTSYGSFDAPNPTFADVLGPNPGVTTGGGDWGSAGAFSAAGTGGGPGGAMVGDIGGFGGGGVFGDYGGGQIGGGGGYTGGQIGGQIGGGGGGYTGGGGGRGGDGPFGSNFGGEGGGRGYAGSPTASPGWEPASPGPSLSSPYADDTGPEGRGEQEGPPAPAPEAPAPEAGPEAGPETANPPGEAPPSEDAPSAAPAGRGIGSDIVASPEGKSAAPTAFGPQSIDYEGSPYADMGPQTDWGSVFEGAAPPDTTDTTDWGSVFEGAAPPGEVGKWSDLPGIFSTGISNTAQSMWDAIQSRGYDAKPWNEISTWFSPLNQQTINELANLPNTLNPTNWVNVQSPMGMPYGQPSSALDMQARGEQGRAGQPTDLANQLGIENITATPDTTDWGSVFEAPAQDPNYAAVFEAPAQDPDFGAVFEGAPSSPDWTSVFEGAAPDPGTEQLQTDRSGIEAYIPGGRETDFEYASNAPTGAPPSYDTTMESGPPGAPTSTDNALTPGGDPALSGLPADAAAAAAAAAGGRPGALPAGSGPTYVTEAAVAAAANAASNAALTAGANPLAGDAASQAAYNAALNLASPTEQATAAMAAALENGATQEQADAIAAAVLDAANSQSGFTPGPTPGQQQQASPGPLMPGAPLGPQPTQETTPPQQGTPPSLVEMAQQGQSGRSETFIPGGRTTDFNYTPSSTPPPPPAANLPPADTSPEDHDAPEPTDSSLPPQDPNAPRPPGDIPAQPGQLRGANGRYENDRADNPRVNRNYRDSGRTDYPQGRPGIDFRTARQAGIQPLFRTEDINVEDVDARLVENVNRALRAMEQRTGIPANSLVATSAYRAAHRGEALEHMMDPRTSQESVYSRYNPNGRNIGPAASPGRSNHGGGRAIDFADTPARAWLRNNAKDFGLETLGRNFDLPHIQLRGGGRGDAGARPSAQEQQAQRALDAQNRQAAIDRGLIGPGRGQAPAQQAGVPTPPARPAGIETGIDPGAEQYASEPLAPSPPAAALPPADLPPEILAPRPPADIPPPALVPPARGRLDPGVVQNILARATAHLTKQSGEAEFQAATVVAAKELARAGVPLATARSEMTKGAYAGAAKNGYDINSWPMGGVYKSKIDGGIEAALQGYQPAKPGEVQGPPSPFAPGKQGNLSNPFVQFVAGGRDVGAPPAIGPEMPGQQRGRAEWEPTLPGQPYGANIETDLSLYGIDPRSGTIFDPEAGRGRVIDPDALKSQQEYQQQFDPRGWRALAKGGHVAEDEPVVVGEEGPETFVPDRPGTVLPHMPQPGQPGNIDRWPKVPAVGFPGQYGGVEREIRRQMRTAQDPVPSLMEMIDSGRLRLNAANWNRMLTDPDLIALGRSRMEDRR